MYEIVSILDNILGPGQVFSNGEYYYFCPLCNHHRNKLAINVNKRKWQCWKCGAKGSTLLSLLKKLEVSREQISKLYTLIGNDVPRYTQDDQHVQIELSLPYEFIPLYDPSNLNTISGANARAYLLRRGYTDDDILRYQIGYCSDGRYGNRIIIPSFDDVGKLNYFVGRNFYETNGMSYLTPPISKNIIGFESFINWNQPIVICEGVFDAMAVKRNAIPIFGKLISKKLREKIITQGVNEIYLALDDDALKDTVELAEKFINEGVSVYVVELKGKDPSVVGFNQMQHLIKHARKITFMDIVKMKLKLVKT